jgi:hypothetical protein
MLNLCTKRNTAMLYRQVKQGKIAITQPMHDWVSGQLARAFRKRTFWRCGSFRRGLPGSRTTRRWPHCMGTGPYAESADGSSLQLPRDAQGTPCAVLVTSRKMRPPSGALRRSAGLGSMAPDETSARDADNDLRRKCQSCPTLSCGGACLPGRTACQLAIRSIL